MSKSQQQIKSVFGDIKEAIRKKKQDKKKAEALMLEKCEIIKDLYQTHLITSILIGVELLVIKPYLKDVGVSFPSFCERCGFGKTKGYEMMKLAQKKEELKIQFGNLKNISISKALEHLNNIKTSRCDQVKADVDYIYGPKYDKILKQQEKEKQERIDKMMDAKYEREIKKEQEIARIQKIEQDNKKLRLIINTVIHKEAVKPHISADATLCVALTDMEFKDFKVKKNTTGETEEKEDRIPVRSERSNPPDLNIPKSNNNDTTSINGERSVIITPLSDIKTPDVNNNNNTRRRSNNGRPQRNRGGRFARQ